MTDKQLYRLCKKYGARALDARRKFIGLLPEVARRELWRRRGYQSIYHFANVLAGVSSEQVDGVLRLEKKFSDLPVLHEVLVKGEVSHNKLARVASLIGSETEQTLVAAVKILPKAALEIWVKEKRQIQNENVLETPRNHGESLPGQTRNPTNFQFEQDVQDELEKLQKQGHDLNEILRDLLKKRKEALEKEKLTVEAEIQAKEDFREAYLERVVADREVFLQLRRRSRYVPSKVKIILQKEFGDRCSAETCQRRAENLHHLKEFADGGLQTPQNLRPLCRGHHQLAHSGFG